MTTLEHYAEINPSPGSLDRSSLESVAFVPMAAVTEDGRLHSPELRVLAEVAKGYTYFERGDVLMAKITPCMENGKAALVDGLATTKGFGSTEFHVLRPRAGVDARFVFYLIWNQRFRNEAAKHMTGSAGQKRVSASYLKQARVPLVDPRDQRRIADILDKADAIRRKRKAAIALTEGLLRSAFLEMFGDPVTNPKRWPMSTFAEQLELLEYGPRFYNEKYSDDGTRIVRITDLEATGELDFSTMPRLLVEPTERQRYVLRPGDLIFARTGATVGKTALIEQDDPEAIPGAYFIRMRFKASVAARFARQVLANDHVQRIIASRSRQSAQQNFSGPGIRELPLPLPPRDLQERLEETAQGQRRLLRRLRLAADASNELFDSLSQNLFDVGFKEESAASRPSLGLLAMEGL